MRFMARRPDFLKPKVFRANDGRFLVIVYNNREETYDKSRSVSFAEATKERGDPERPYTRHDSEELCRNSSMKEVQFSDELEVVGMVCSCPVTENFTDSILYSGGCTCKLMGEGSKGIGSLRTRYIEINKEK